MSASQAKALRSLAEPVVAAQDCDLEDVVIRQAGKRRLVRIVVDHRGGGLTLDLVAGISRGIANVLDDSTVLGNSPYVLEVTSPGVDRPLTLPRHWARAVSRLVLVTPATGSPFEGRVLRTYETHAILEVDGSETSVAYSDVSRAVVQVEFTRLEDAEFDDPDADDHVDADGVDPAEDTEDADHANATDPEEG